MVIQQIYTGCLAQGAYYIESEGEVAIIDPLREVQPYIEMAKKKRARHSSWSRAPSPVLLFSWP